MRDLPAVHSHVLTRWLIAVLLAGLFGWPAAARADTDPMYWVTATHLNDERGATDILGMPNGKRLYETHWYSHGGGAVTVLENGSAVTSRIPIGHASKSMVLSRDGSRLYVAVDHAVRREQKFAGGVYVIDTSTNKVISVILTGPHNGAVTGSVTLSPDGTRVYEVHSGSGPADGRVSVIDTSTNTVVDTLQFEGTPAVSALSPDGDHLYVSDTTTGRISVISLSSRAVAGSYEGPKYATALMTDPEGTRLYVPDRDAHGVRAVTIATGATTIINTGGNPFGMAADPPHHRVFITDAGTAGRVMVIDTRTDTITGSFPAGDGPTMLTMDRSGTNLDIITGNPLAVTQIDLTSEERQVFPDVPPGTDFFHQIGWMGSSGISTGYPDGTFRPVTPVNRDAMAAFLYEAAGEPYWPEPGISPFKDIKPGDQFYKQVTWLASTHITTGYSDGTFRPCTPISREAMAAFLHRFATSLRMAPKYAPPPGLTVPGHGPVRVPHGHRLGCRSRHHPRLPRRKLPALRRHQPGRDSRLPLPARQPPAALPLILTPQAGHPSLQFTRNQGDGSCMQEESAAGEKPVNRQRCCFGIDAPDVAGVTGGADVRTDVLLCTSGSAATPDIIGALQEFGAGCERDRDFPCGSGERKVRPLSMGEGGDRGITPIGPQPSG